MSSTVGIGMIGCGGRQQALARTLLADRDGLRVVALCDPSEEAINATQRLCSHDAKVYGDITDLIADPEVDWVMIGTPNSLHREQAIAAMEAGKDVFCEKPLATTFEDCIAMRDVHQRTGKKFFIGFTLRYSPHYTRLQQLIAEGAVGQIISMELNETLGFNHGGFIHQDWRRLTRFGGPLLLEKCCHDIDVANWLTDSLPTRVASFGGCNFFRPENAHHIDRVGPKPGTGEPPFMTHNKRPNVTNPFVADKDVVDNQVVIMEYANDVRATFFFNCSTGMPQRRAHICGTEGTLVADALRGEIQIDRIAWDEPTVIHHSKTGGGGHGGADPKLTDWLAQCMLEDAAPPSTLAEGLTSAVVCFAIDQAMNEHTVVDLRPWWEQLDIEIQGPTHTASA